MNEKEKEEVFKRMTKRGWARELLLNKECHESLTQIIRIFFLAQPDCYESIEKAKQALKRALDLAVDFLYEICEENMLEEPEQ